MRSNKLATLVEFEAITLPDTQQDHRLPFNVFEKGLDLMAAAGARSRNANASSSDARAQVRVRADRELYRQ